MISFAVKGDFNNTEGFLKGLKEKRFLKKLDRYGSAGVQALSDATPKDTGKTSASWDYRIEDYEDHTSIVWTNSNVQNGVNIAIILQYGHGTRNGGYVQGRDYINPAIQPIFDELADSAWKEVTAL